MPMQQQSGPLVRKKVLHAVCRNHYKKIVDTATDRGPSMGYPIIAREALRRYYQGSGGLVWKKLKATGGMPP